MQVSVLGASGFIGSSLCERLVKATDCEVRGVCRVHGIASRSRRDPPSTMVSYDILGEQKPPDFLPASDVIVDLVSIGPVAPVAASYAALGASVRNHVAFVEEVVGLGFSGRYIYLSSGGAVYGNPTRLPLAESHPTCPISPYGCEKLFIEANLERLADRIGLDLVILRPGNVYGEHQRSRPGFGLIPTIYERVRSRQPVTIFGSATAGLRDYVHEQDLNSAIIAAAKYRAGTGAKGAVFNIGTGVGTLTQEVCALTSAILRRPVSYRFRDLRETDVSTNILDARRAMKELGWVAKIALYDGLAATLSAWNADRSSVEPSRANRSIGGREGREGDHYGTKAHFAHRRKQDRKFGGPKLSQA